MLSGPHKVFADSIVKGLNNTEAYAVAYPKASPDAARKNAPRLMSNDDIISEIARLRAKADVAADGPVLTLAMKRRFFHDVVMTPAAKIDENSYLCQEVTRSRRSDGCGEEAEEWETKKIKLPCKLKAIELDSRHTGEFEPEKVEITGETFVSIGEG